MKIVLILSICIILRAKAWSSIRAPFNLIERSESLHFITDCMHVASEEGDYAFKKTEHPSVEKRDHNIVEVLNPDMAVCGLYVVADADKYIQISIKYLDINCDTGGLMAFVDGWELNGQYFPGIHDHQLDLDKRVTEFCSETGQWPYKIYRKKFMSSQNAALLQYRIPINGAFVVNVKFVHNPKPCHIMAEGVTPFYTLSNYGANQNCTLTAFYPAVVAIRAVSIGSDDTLVNYDCGMNNKDADKLEIGGSAGLDSHNMEVASHVCGNSEKLGPEQAIFCGVTSVRLISSGKFNNHAIVSIRKFDEKDLDLITLMCSDLES